MAERSRTAIHNRVQKADLQATGGASPARVALDQKLIHVNDEKHWLYAAVDPATNKFPHARLFPTYTIPIPRHFLAELTEKHDVTAAVFLTDVAGISEPRSAQTASRTASKSTAGEIRSDVSSAR